MKSKLLSMIVALCVLLSCVTIPAQAAGLTVYDTASDGLLSQGSSDWMYDYDKKPTTEASAGIGGKAVGDAYTLYETSTGGKSDRGGYFMSTQAATLFAQPYLVFTGNFYGSEPVNLTARYSTNTSIYTTTDSDFDANKWNNFAFVYNTTDKEMTVYVNGVQKAQTTTTMTTTKGQIRMTLVTRQDGVSYYVDDLGMYFSDTAPTIAMPTLSAGTNYTVSGDAITLTGAATVADLVAQTGATVRAYTDSTLATALESTATLSNGNYVVVEAPFNDASEGVKVYNYYSVGAGSEGGEGGEDPEPEVPEGIGGVLPDNENITWTYDEDTKVLSFEGTGAMTDWVNGTDYGYTTGKFTRAWANYAESVEKVVIGEGITSIGMNSFRAFTKLTEVVFPATSLTAIKDGAFALCTSLKTITLPASVDTIGEGAFKVKADANAALESFTFLGNPTSIDYSLFDHQRDTLVIYTNSTNTNVVAMAKTKIYDYVLLDKDYEIVYDADTQIATARNFTKSPVDVAIIVASYGSGCLADVDFTTVTIPAAGKEGKQTLTFTGTHVPGGYVRAMLWDGFDTVTPLCPFARVSIAAAE